MAPYLRLERGGVVVLNAHEYLFICKAWVDWALL